MQVYELTWSQFVVLQYELAGVMGKGPPQKIGIFVYSDNPWLFKKWEMNDISVWLKIV